MRWATLVGALCGVTVQAGDEKSSGVRLPDAHRLPLNEASTAREGADPARPPMNAPQLQAMVQLALADAGRRSRLDPSELKVVLAEAVTWPDGSLGCPRPDMMYTQALVPGYRIRIVAGGQTLEYHASQRGQPFYCPASRISGPIPDSRI